MKYVKIAEVLGCVLSAMEPCERCRNLGKCPECAGTRINEKISELCNLGLFSKLKNLLANLLA